MKVLRTGRAQQGWAQERACTGHGNGGGGCGAVLLVEEGDVYLTKSHAREETTTYLTFSCPECGVETDVEGAPAPAWNAARARKDMADKMKSEYTR